MNEELMILLDQMQDEDIELLWSIVAFLSHRQSGQSANEYGARLELILNHYEGII